MIAFELDYAEAAPRLYGIVRAASGAGAVADTRHGFTDIDFALERAAELAFATEDLARGLKISERLTRETRPRTPMQLALCATVGAATGMMAVELQFDGVVLRGHRTERVMRLEWPHEDSSYVVALMRHFVPAAAATSRIDDVLIPLLRGSEQPVLRPQAMAVVAASEECRAVAKVPL